MALINKELLQNQIALFFKNDFQGLFEKVSLSIKTALNDQNAGVQILNLPLTAPSEIPRLILNFKSNNININFSKNRVDIFFENYTSQKEDIEKIIKVIINELEIDIGRIGFVSNYFFTGDIQDLKSFFVPEKITIINPTEITLRINTQSTIDGHTCNNSQNIQNGIVAKGAIKKNGIIVMRDINTLPSEIKEKSFDFSKANSFIIKADIEAQTMIIE